MSDPINRCAQCDAAGRKDYLVSAVAVLSVRFDSDLQGTNHWRVECSQKHRWKYWEKGTVSAPVSSGSAEKARGE